MENQNIAPIADAMKNYSNDGALAFHTPGHKQGLGAHFLLKELIAPEGLRREVSLMEELDDLHSPKTCIKDAQNLAAQLWNADAAFFMINGTTSAIQAMIMSTLNPGDLVFIPRNAHRSVISGLILSGARPVYLAPEYNSNFQIPLNLSVETIKQAIALYPAAKALIIVSPNYYGVAADLPEIAKILHEHKMLLLVDEAHGAHLHFNENLPISALDAGADIVAQSTHKLLGSLTQTSMLFVKSKFVDIERVKRVSSLLQSTSPNYLLLASLDIARLQMYENGAFLIKRAIDLSKTLRTEIYKIDGLRTFDKIKNFSLDFTKVTVNVSALGISGNSAENILRHKFKIQCELSDANNILFLITYADNDNTIDKLIIALKNLTANFHKETIYQKIYSPINKKITPSVLTPRDAFYSPVSSVKLNDATGKVCAEEITFYPPGIPILYPGELITSDIINEILALKNTGSHVIGAADNKLDTIKIVDF